MVIYYCYEAWDPDSEQRISCRVPVDEGLLYSNQMMMTHIRKEALHRILELAPNAQDFHLEYVYHPPNF